MAALLGPHDELLRLPGARDAALWNAGATRARTPWLVFSEGHCLADPGCLDAVARWLASGPTVEVGNLDVGHDTSFLHGRLSQRWFDMIHARWREPGEWPRVSRSGFVIRADVFRAIGGFEPEYGQFAPALLSARLHARGIRIGAVPGAAVVHLDNAEMHASPCRHRRLRARRARRAFAQRPGVLRAILRPRTGVGEPAPSPAPHRALHGPRRHHGGRRPSGARGRARRAPAGARDRHDRRHRPAGGARSTRRRSRRDRGAAASSAGRMALGALPPRSRPRDPPDAARVAGPPGAARGSRPESRPTRRSIGSARTR